MGTLEPRAFERPLGELGPDAMTRFVADLWSTRGRTTRVVGSREVRVIEDASSDRRLLVYPGFRRLAWNRLSPGRDRLEEVDAVVTNGKIAPLAAIAVEPETAVFDPADLDQIATYALDEQRRTALYRDHFGNSPEGAAADAGSTAGLLGRVRSKASSWLPFVPRRYVSVRNAAILVCCWLLVVGVGSPHPVLEPGADGGAVGSQSFDNADSSLQVGALANGSVSALLNRHRQSLTDGSAVLVVRHDGTSDKVFTQRRWERSHFRLSQTGDGAWDLAVSGILAPTTIGGEPNEASLLLTGTGQSCERDQISMGEAHLTEALCSAVAAENTVAVVSSAYVDRYLNGEQLTVEGTENRPGGKFTVVSSVPPADMAPGVRNYTARAVVTPDGIVRAVTVSYRVQADASEARRTLSIQVESGSTQRTG